MKKNHKIAPSQRKLKNARQRHKYRLEKRGFSKKTVDTLLDGFRDEFEDESGRVNVGNLSKAEIDRRISQHINSRFTLTYQELAELLRYNMNDPIDDSKHPFIKTFGVEVFDPDNWESQIKLEDLQRFYRNINDPGYNDTLQDLVDMIIKNKLR